MRKLQRELTRAACKMLRISPVQLSSKPFFKDFNFSKDFSELFSKEDPEKKENEEKKEKWHDDKDKESEKAKTGFEVEWKSMIKIPKYEDYKHYFWVLGLLSILFLGVYASEVIRVRSYEPINVR